MVREEVPGEETRGTSERGDACNLATACKYATRPEVSGSACGSEFACNDQITTNHANLLPILYYRPLRIYFSCFHIIMQVFN